MSDFLGNLVARSLELAPAVQPRLASLFEPVAGAAIPEPAFDSTDATERAAAPSPAQRGRVGEGVSRPSEEDPSPALPRAVAREREPFLPAPAPVVAVPVPAPIRPMEEEERRPIASPRQQEPSALQPLVPRIEIPEPLPSTRIERTELLRRETREIRTVEPAAPVTPAPPGLVVQPRVERAAPAPLPEAPAPAPAPTIHVTIGRIEVRATAPQTSAAPARRAPAPAVPTLDEYLRRRDGERP